MYEEQVEPFLKEKVKDDIRIMIGDFSILWNLYEKYFFEEAEKRYREEHNLKRKSDKIYQENIHEGLIKVLNEEGFMINNSGEIEKAFNRLRHFLLSNSINLDINASDDIIQFFRVYDNKNAKDEIRKLFNNSVELWDITEKFHFLLVIVYRVRNNMFHGLKPIVKLRKEKELFYVCNNVLSLIINPIEKYIRNYI